MSKTPLSVVSPVQSEHAEAMIDLGAKTFGGFYSARRSMREWYLLNSHYDWEASAVGFCDGKLVTHYGVWGYDMRIGKSVVRCGGIGMVATDGDYQKRGFMAQTVPHSIQQMKQRGYDLSILFGIRDFYHRFGYVLAWGEQNWLIHRDQLPADLPKVKYESFPCVPKDTIARLHNRFNATVTGSAVRPTFSKKFYLYRDGLEGYQWKDARGKVCGHVLVYQDGGRLVCAEGTGKVDDVFAVLKSLCEKKNVGEIRFDTLPYLSPLARRLRTLTCRFERHYMKSGNAMVRVINLKSCLWKMEAELSDRMRKSELCDYRGELLLSYPEASVGLTISRGKVTVAAKVSARNSIRGGFELGQLLIGTDEPAEVCESRKMRTTGEAIRLAKVLFPNEHPQIHQADRY